MAVDSRRLARFADLLLEKLGLERELAIVLVSDRKMAELNKTFTGRIGTTDVLSFAGDAGAGYLGDIVISVETAARNARRYRRRPEREIENLIIHGVLHLVGHHRPHKHMRRLERKLHAELRRRLAGRKKD